MQRGGLHRTQTGTNNASICFKANLGRIIIPHGLCGRIEKFPMVCDIQESGGMECSEAERNVPHFLGCHKPWGIFLILPHKPWGIIILPRFAVKQTNDRCS